MRNLHKISESSFIFTDRLLSQIWALRKDEDYQPKEIRLTTAPPRYKGESPIQYTFDNGWWSWSWEDWRLEEWIAAGKPKVDTSNITIGKFIL